MEEKTVVLWRMCVFGELALLTENKWCNVCSYCYGCVAWVRCTEGCRRLQGDTPCWYPDIFIVYVSPVVTLYCFPGCIIFRSVVIILLHFQFTCTRMVNTNHWHKTPIPWIPTAQTIDDEVKCQSSKNHLGFLWSGQSDVPEGWFLIAELVYFI